MVKARLNDDILSEILEEFEEKKIIREEGSRHKEQAYYRHNTVFSLNRENIKQKKNIQLLFDLVITRRARSIGEEGYENLTNEFTPKRIKESSELNDAIEYLEGLDDIGQKITNEFLRVYVHVFEAKDWVEELDVPLDTHVLQALVKTGVLEREGYNYQDTARMVNKDRHSGAYSRISYSQLQDAFKNADPNYPGIIFDELWLENSVFLSSQNKALKERSCLFNMT